MATAAATAAADTMVTASLRTFRRRARRVISSNVPGGGGSGWACWLSPRASGARSSLASTVPPALPSPIDRPAAFLAALALGQCLLEFGPGMVQVRLDRSLGPFHQRRYLLDAEPGVVVQQERIAKLGGQRGDELAHVHVLGRVGRRFRVAARGDGAHRPALPLGLAPVVPDQVGGDHEEVTLRVVELVGAGPLR